MKACVHFLKVGWGGGGGVGRGSICYRRAVFYEGLLLERREG